MSTHKHHPTREHSTTEEFKKKVKELEDGWQRTQADFENYRKRVESQRADLIQYANQELILKIVPVLENFRRAAEHIPQCRPSLNQEEITKISSWIEGIKSIEKQIESILADEGVEKIATTGKKFDPYFHEAVAYEEHSNQEEGMIVNELEAGYQMRDKVIKPAKVRVSKGK
jgi:molecular chaperone GrpE